MSETRIFSVPENSGSSNSLLAMLPALLQRQGVDPGLIALARSGNGSGWGDGGIFGILLLFILMGLFNRNGGGLFGGCQGGYQSNGQGGIMPVLNNDANTAVILQSVQRNGYDLSTLATAMNTSTGNIINAINALGTQICGVGNQVGMSAQQIINSIQMGNSGLATQLAECCCTLRDSITRQGFENQLGTERQTNTLQNAINFVNSSVERGFASTSYETQRQTCDLQKTIEQSTEKILAGQRAAEMRELMRENAQLRDEKQAFQASALSQAQKQDIINSLRPTPVPAYPVCPGAAGLYGGYPYGAYGNPYGSDCGGC